MHFVSSLARTFSAPPARLLCLALASSSLATTAWADLDPLWLTDLPVGAALGAGMQGVAVGPGGETYVTGTSGASANTDISTAAYSASGELLWSHVFNGPSNSFDQSRAMALGPDGALWVAGNTAGPGGFANVLLLKFDTADGALLDTVQYSSGFASEFGGSIATDLAGNVYVGGGTGPDGLVLSFDGNGNFRWKKTYDGPAFGPFSQDSVLQVQVAPDGDVVALVHGIMATNHPDYVVIKYAAATGSVIWQTNWGVAGADSPRDMVIDASGDIFVTGVGLDVVNKFSTIRLKGSDGALLWQAYDVLGFHNVARAIALDGNGGVYVTGSIDPDGDQSNQNDNIRTIRRNAESGAFEWSHVYGADCLFCLDLPGDVAAEADGHVFVAGSTNSPPYANDLIHLVLDGFSGEESDRGSVDPGPNHRLGVVSVRLDVEGGQIVAGNRANDNTGQVSMAVSRWASFSILPGDLNSDGAVDGVDLGLLLATWGACPGCPADIDGDGVVGGADLGALLAAW